MSDETKQIILLLAKWNMNVSAVATRVGLGRHAMDNRLIKIKEETGLDPLNFFDLHELYQIVTSEVEQ